MCLLLLTSTNLNIKPWVRNLGVIFDMHVINLTNTLTLSLNQRLYLQLFAAVKPQLQSLILPNDCWSQMLQRCYCVPAPAAVARFPKHCTGWCLLTSLSFQVCTFPLTELCWADAPGCPEVQINAQRIQACGTNCTFTSGLSHLFKSLWGAAFKPEWLYLWCFYSGFLISRFLA